MFSSISTVVLNLISDMTQNPVSLTIFGILTLIVIALSIAMVSTTMRDFLTRIKILEEDEEPSSLLIWIVGIIILVKLVQAFLIQPFIVDGASMLPTYHNKEFLLVDKFSYRIKDPVRGDIMIFKLYENNLNPYEGKHLIKRVIGLPGERVVVKNGVTTIYNTKYPNGFVLEEPFVEFKEFTKNADVTLDENHYFMMGDNRDRSYDSRDWGGLDLTNIKGQVLFRVYPFKQAGYEPGRYSFTK